MSWNVVYVLALLLCTLWTDCFNKPVLWFILFSSTCSASKIQRCLSVDELITLQNSLLYKTKHNHHLLYIWLLFHIISWLFSFIAIQWCIGRCMAVFCLINSVKGLPHVPWTRRSLCDARRWGRGRGGPPQNVSVLTKAWIRCVSSLRPLYLLHSL